MTIASEGGKLAGSIVEVMKSAPLALALLVVNLLFIGFVAYFLSEVAANARERNASQTDLIKTLVQECGTKPKASIMFRSAIDRARRTVEPPK